MLKKTFIMLAAPGMIGKSTAAQAASKPFPMVHMLENDELMQKLFDIVRLPRNLPINEMAEWRSEVSKKADCDKLIRLLHRDEVSRHNEKSVVLAEGYPYMRQWYRNQVRDGLQRLDFTIEYWLLQYYPPLDEQVRRRAKKSFEWGWDPKSYSFDEQEIIKSWDDFQSPTDEAVHFEKVDDARLMEIMKQIVGD